MASTDCKIAIVGMACRFPGGANDPAALWKLLEAGKCTMEDIPSSRFNIDDYWSKDGDKTNRLKARRGHFLHEGALFDEMFFNLSPREAMNTDPQHRILLETVKDALDDSGYKPSNDGGERGWDKSRMGVFVGSATDSYQNNLASDIDAFFCPGTIRGFASGRISHHFGWQGPSVVYDTACSSGLVSIHAACQSLALGESDAAIASGTNMLTSPEMFIGLSKGYFISNTGGCRTFDETADGYCRAEGVGVLVLKRLEDAVRDKDKVEAIIIASGINQSGTTDSLTKPHFPTQTMLFKANCARANIPPLAIRAVEAHGTGTQAGDYAEMEAIKNSYCEGRPQLSSDGRGQGMETALFVSSLKPNIGHAESTSGIASVIKATLMMKNRLTLPHIGISTQLNPRLGNLTSHGIIIPIAIQPLLPIAGYDDIFVSVNNFGAPGGNANVILQESRAKSSSAATDPRKHHIITLSAKTHTPFITIIERFLCHLDQREADIDLASLSYTTTARRMDYPSRLAFSVSTIDELKEELKKSPSPIIQKSGSTPRIGFVIGGNGSQYKGMGKTLYNTSTIFRAYIDQCDASLKRIGGPGVLGVITGETDPFGQDRDAMLASAASIFSVSYGLGKTWEEWGVKPSILIGHSLGEYAGLALAGCLSVDDVMQLILRRTNALHDHDISSLDGAMLVMGASASDTRVIIETSGCSGLNISCYNGRVQSCVSGPRVELLKLQAFAKTLPEPPLTKVLPGKFAWHSPSMEQTAKELQKAAEGVTFTEPKIPILLNLDGSVLGPGDTPSASYLSEQTVMPVRFDLCASHSLAQDIDIWIEISAKTIILPLLRTLVPAGKALLPTIGGSDEECWSSITKTLGRLYEAHVGIDWAKYHESYPVHLVTLPSYPFARNKHWVEYRDRLHRNPIDARKDCDVISTPLGVLEVLSKWSRYRLLTRAQNPLQPGAYLWLALSCTQSNRVVDFQVTHPADQSTYLTVIVEGSGPNNHTVDFVRHEKESLENGWLVASCKVESSSFVTNSTMDKVLERSRARLAGGPTSFFSRVVLSNVLGMLKFTSGGQEIESLTVADDREEAVGRIQWNAPTNLEHSALSNIPFSPGQLTTLLQPACVAVYMTSSANLTNPAFGIEKFEFVEDFGVKMKSSLRVIVHVLLETFGGDAAIPQSFVYSEDGSSLARMVGFSTQQSSSARKAEPCRVVSLPPSPSVPALSVSPVPFTELGEDSTTSSPSEPEVVQTSQPHLAETTVVSILAAELGIPAHGISMEDRLEDLGIDSILSLLLRDKASKLAGKRLEWFTWKRGVTVRGLAGYIADAQGNKN